ncbi:hypothetical protein [Mucilaginibacter sp.]|uniref:hypothetical protein n=1 Tax=Mucilaginibacter sp. TaxID=1882438 RepID=UPI002623467F|nr:hypothetical protein [Mucilaginibacter sp.]MDB4924245.1 hypothetical protein [Mucilaginibacter sp.]
MKHIFKLALFAFIVGAYSCHSLAKKTEVENPIIDTTTPQTKVGEIKSTPANIDYGKQDDSLNKPGDTKIIFPSFAIKIPNFKVYNRFDNDKLVYEVDSSETTVSNNNKGLVVLTAQKDTVHLTIGVYSTSYDAIEAISSNKDDRFKIEFSYHLIVYQNDEASFLSNSPVDKKKLVRWNGMTDYVSLTDSANYFFKLPRAAYSSIFIKNDIKKKIAVRDTLIDCQREDDQRSTLIYKGKPCGVNQDVIYFRIRKFNKNSLIDTKYIGIDLPYID